MEGGHLAMQPVYKQLVQFEFPFDFHILDAPALEEFIRRMSRYLSEERN